MLRVYMRKLEAMDENEETEVLIKVTINTPRLGAEPFLGVYFKNAPQVTISEVTLPFSDMKKVMDYHNFKSWKEVKSYIEEKYASYYLQMFQDWDNATETKTNAN